MIHPGVPLASFGRHSHEDVCLMTAEALSDCLRKISGSMMLFLGLKAWDGMVCIESTFPDYFGSDHSLNPPSLLLSLKSYHRPDYDIINRPDYDIL